MPLVPGFSSASLLPGHFPSGVEDPHFRLEDVLSGMEVSQLLHQHWNSWLPVIPLLCGRHSKVPPARDTQTEVLEDTSKPPGEATVPQSSLHLWGVSVVLPRAEQIAPSGLPGDAILSFWEWIPLSAAGKGKLGDVANNLQQLKLHGKHLAWKIRQSRKNSTYYQYNTAEVSFLEIIISDSSSKNKGQKLEEARKHDRGSESQ